MVRSSGFGSITRDKRPIQARFHYGSNIHCLNLPLPISRRLILQQARSQTFNNFIVVLLLLVSLWFHVLFTPLTGVLFTFPSRYYFTIGHSGIFSLMRWSSQIHTGLHVPHATRDTNKIHQIFDYKTITFYGWAFHLIHLILGIFNIVPQPSSQSLGFSHFARRY